MIYAALTNEFGSRLRILRVRGSSFLTRAQ